jgi:hypothetical protein
MSGGGSKERYDYIPPGWGADSSEPAPEPFAPPEEEEAVSGIKGRVVVSGHHWLQRGISGEGDSSSSSSSSSTIILSGNTGNGRISNLGGASLWQCPDEEDGSRM